MQQPVAFNAPGGERPLGSGGGEGLVLGKSADSASTESSYGEIGDVDSNE